jgi:hypothetical protein
VSAWPTCARQVPPNVARIFVIMRMSLSSHVLVWLLLMLGWTSEVRDHFAVEVADVMLYVNRIAGACLHT